MGDIPLSTILGGGSILVTLFYFVFRGGGLNKFNKIFSKNQDMIKNKIEKLELQEKVHVMEVKESETKVKEVKKKVEEFVVKAKKEIEETGKISEPNKLLKEFEKW